MDESKIRVYQVYTIKTTYKSKRTCNTDVASSFSLYGDSNLNLGEKSKRKVGDLLRII